jgi:hypothetical protein
VLIESDADPVEISYDIHIFEEDHKKRMSALEGVSPDLSPQFLVPRWRV